MKNEDLSRFRTILLELEREIQAEIDQGDASASSIKPDNAIGRLTRMEAIQAKSISDAGKTRQGKRLASIRNALDSLDDGTYGSCASCGGEISPGRLEIRPESRLCVGCATRR